MKKVILMLAMLILLCSSVFATGVVFDKSNPENWYYPGTYKGTFNEAREITPMPGHTGVAHDYRVTYKKFNRGTHYRGYRYNRFGSNYGYGSQYGIVHNYNSDRFLGFDRWGNRVYSTDYGYAF
jgi:hypothetical protein